MAKLRRMLGDIQSEACIALMTLIETQSAKTLAAWSIRYVKAQYLSSRKRYKSGGKRRIPL